MRNKKKKSNLLVIFLAIASGTAIAALRGPNAHDPGGNKEAFSQGRAQTPRIDENQIPIVDYDASDLNQLDRAKRANKSKRYNGRHLKESPSAPVSIVTSHWLVKLPALPIAISDAVVIGEVVNAQAFLSEDKKGVYSEFAVHVESILKDNSHIPLTLNNIVTTEREGGRVRFPSGQTSTLVAEYQGLPLIGHKYLFFLRRGEDEPNIFVLVAYELSEGRVFPIDGKAIRNGQLLAQFAPYDGAELEAFLIELRDAIRREAEQTSKATK